MSAPIITEAVTVLFESKRFKRILFLFSTIPFASLFLLWPSQSFDHYFLSEESPLLFYVVFFIILLFQFFFAERITAGAMNPEGMLSFNDLLKSGILSPFSIIIEKTIVLFITNLFLVIMPLPVYAAIAAVCGLPLIDTAVYVLISCISILVIQQTTLIVIIWLEDHTFLLSAVPWAIFGLYVIGTYNILPAANSIIVLYRDFNQLTPDPQGTFKGMTPIQSTILWNVLFFILLWVISWVSLVLRKREIATRKIT